MTIVNDNRANEPTKEPEKNETEKTGSIEKTPEKLAKSGWLENWPPSMGAASLNEQGENHFLLDIERWGLEMDGLTQGQGLSQRRPSPESRRRFWPSGGSYFQGKTAPRGGRPEGAGAGGRCGASGGQPAGLSTGGAALSTGA